MATMQATNTLDAYDITSGIREDFMNMIYNIAPVETPYVSMIAGKGSQSQSYKEWQLDDLADADATPTVEGAEFQGDALTSPTRVGNHAQINRKDILVSDRANVSNKAGRNSEFRYEIQKAGKEIKRNVETAALLRQAATVGAGPNTAGRTAGVPAWIRTNHYHNSTGGSDPELSSSDGLNGYPDVAGAGGTIRGLTQTMLLTAIRDAWTAGGEPSWILVSPQLKQNISGYLLTGSSARAATQYQDQGKMGTVEGLHVSGAVTWYDSDFGRFKIMPDRFQPTTEVFILDSEYWEISYFRGYRVINLPKSGDNQRGFVLVDWSVCSKNEEASALISGINEATALVA